MNPYPGLPDTQTPTIAPVPRVGLERCPLCDSAITRKRFVEIESRIREEEQRKLEEQRRNLKEHQRKLEEEYRVKNQAFQVEVQKKAKAEVDARLLTITRERDVALAQVKNVQEQIKKMVAEAEARARDAIAKEYEKKNLARIAEEARKLGAAQKTIDHLQRQLTNKTANSAMTPKLTSSRCFVMRSATTELRAYKKVSAALTLSTRSDTRGLSRE
jgi:hypothetical protein